ncbi:thioesterase [Streptomyces olivaceus]
MTGTQGTQGTQGTPVGPAAFSAESRWIRRAARPSAALRLICLPFAGGGASVFADLPGLLPESVEVVAVQPPGREDRSREEAPGDLGALVRACAVALRPYCTVPYALYGHCAGALLAYEVAQTMGERFGVWPRTLVAGAQPAPHLPASGPVLHELPDGELLGAVRARGGIPDALLDKPAFLEFLLPVLRADFRLWERYEYRARPPLPVPVTTLRGRDDRLVRPQDAQAWREHTSVGASDRLVDGGHYFIKDMSLDAARTLAEVLLAH